MNPLQPSKLRRSERFQAHSCKRVGSEAVRRLARARSCKRIEKAVANKDSSPWRATEWWAGLPVPAAPSSRGENRTETVVGKIGDSSERRHPFVNGERRKDMSRPLHQSQLPPAANKFHVGNGEDQKHYWLTPPDIYAALDAEFHFDFDPCPFPLPDGFDGLTCEWGQSNYVNPPFGSIIHQGKKKGPTAWMRKGIEERRKGKLSVIVYPVDKWVLMMAREILGEHADIRNLGDVRWLATEDGSEGKGTGRHIACFVLRPMTEASD